MSQMPNFMGISTSNVIQKPHMHTPNWRRMTITVTRRVQELSDQVQSWANVTDK